MTDKDDDKDKPLKIVFAEGCMDGFEGTQEELDELIAQIKEMVASGEFLKNSVPVEDIDEEVLELLPLLNTGNTRQ